MGSLRLEGFEKEVDGRLVKVIGGGAQTEGGRSGRTLLRIQIAAEVDDVRGEYTMTFSRRGADNAAVGRAYAKADVAERFSALIKALTGEEPRVYEKGDGETDIVCYREHLEGFMRYTELAEAIEKWLEETSRR